MKTLNFDLGRPLSLHFLRRYSKAGDVTAEHHTFAKMALEASFVEYRVAHILPSKMAAAALLLGLRTIDGWLIFTIGSCFSPGPDSKTFFASIEDTLKFQPIRAVT